MPDHLETSPLGPPPADAVRMPHPTREGASCAARIWFRDWHDSPRQRGRHNAQDVFAPRGTPVFAPVSGRVVEAGESARGGLHVRINTRDGLSVYLAHLDTLGPVEVGDRIEAGTWVGTVGNTGNAVRFCPHLHIQARRGREYINLYSDLVELLPGRHGRRATRESGDSEEPGGGVALAGALLLLLLFTRRKKGGR